jgi:uncharacterized membrane protein
MEHVRQLAQYFILSINQSIYCAYLQSVIQYGIVLWSDSSNSKRMFASQKKAVGIMAGAKRENHVEDCLRD